MTHIPPKEVLWNNTISTSVGNRTAAIRAAVNAAGDSLSSFLHVVFLQSLNVLALICNKKSRKSAKIGIQNQSADILVSHSAFDSVSI